MINMNFQCTDILILSLSARNCSSSCKRIDRDTGSNAQIMPLYSILFILLHVNIKLTRRRVCRTTVMVWPVVEVQLSREQCGENVVRVVRITTRHTFQINRGARYWTPGRKTSTLLRKGAGTRQWRWFCNSDGYGGTGVNAVYDLAKWSWLLLKFI